MPRPKRPWRFGVPLALSAGLLLASASAPGRELHWSSMQVRARLDASGVLHVTERQAMVFTGDWNGGERLFRLFPGQVLRLQSLRRVGPDGAAVDLTAGDLSAVDRYAWHDSKTLRWRSRLPGDPPFDATEIVYEISYTLGGILLKEGDRYVLDHDFAFPDREGPIEKFTLDLAVDPPWRAEAPLAGPLTRGPLPAGTSVVLRIPLTWTGEGAPAVGRTSAGRGTRLFAFLLLLALSAAAYLRFRSAEKAAGRFGAPPEPDRVDRAWLEQNLFTLSPEEAGALWDGRVGPPEVSAVLARLSAEKKIETEVRDEKLSMKLQVPVDRLSGYEESLVRSLFFGGRQETDTEAIRKHYRSSGFDPASKIRGGLLEKLSQRPEFGDRAPGTPFWPAPVIFVVGLVLLSWAGIASSENPGELIGIGITHFLLGCLGVGLAALYRSRADKGEAFSLVFLWVPAVVLLFAWMSARSTEPVSTVRVAGVFLLRLAIVVGVLAMARTREGPLRVARRKALSGARAFFRRELTRAEPRLEDAWFPWVVAFGLTGAADRWFKAHGPAGGDGSVATGSSRSSSGSSSSSSGSPSPSSWTGGGGAFGGAGASASWAAAAGSIASGVAAPSSGGSGGGGGGGGGSSGGGGGGGW